MDASQILRRLREEPQQLDELIELGLEHLLAQPLSALVDHEWLAEAIAEGIRSSAQSDEFEGWVAERVERALTHADGLEGTLADRMPVTILGPLQQALGREYQPDEALARAVLDHASTRKILREILQANLLEFGKRMRAMVPDTKLPSSLPGSGFASRLAGVARGVATAVGSELERQLEPKVDSFVDDILGETIDVMIRRVSSEEFSGDFASYRVDVFHAMLGQPIARLSAERHKYPPRALAADVAAVLRALAAWRNLSETIAKVLSELVHEYGGSSAREFLEGSGLEEAWRPQLQRALTLPARELVASEAFAGWLERLTSEA